jgi:hypothetical protein
MNIQELITREGIWEGNPEATFRYYENLYQQKGLEEEEADNIIRKTSDVWFMFKGDRLWYYGKTPYSSKPVVFAKYYFQVDDWFEAIKMYREADFSGEPVLTFDVKSLDENRVIFFIEEEKMYFVCDYTTDKSKFPEE